MKLFRIGIKIILRKIMLKLIMNGKLCGWIGNTNLQRKTSPRKSQKYSEMNNRLKCGKINCKGFASKEIFPAIQKYVGLGKIFDKVSLISLS